MKKHIPILAGLPVSLLSLAISSATVAQTSSDQTGAGQPSQSEKIKQITLKNPVEEVLVLGRLKGGAHDLVMERMEFESVVDLLGAEQIARIGDSTAAVALKRVPGVTLVDGKFIYVRGLGERYSSSTLNGATVPSPDLTRNVLPLDIFPASIIESLAVQKGFTADMPAAFGGGSIDIRTKGIPDTFVFGLEGSIGLNTDSDEGLSYRGGSNDHLGDDDGTRALGAGILTGLRTYFGSLEASEFSLDANAIQSTFARNGNPITLEQAQAINAELATEIYRDLDVTEDSSSIQDGDAGVTIGNVFNLGNLFEFGFLATADYSRSTRTTQRIERFFRDPEEEFRDQKRTTENVSITATANLGLRWGDDHEISSKNIFLRNTDDEVSITNIFNNTSPFSSGQGARNWDYRFEQRELEIYQIMGQHRLGYDTKERFGIADTIFDDLQFNWYFSDSTATTDIPSETNIKGNITRDVASDEIVSSRLLNSLSLMDVRFTDLEDEVESSGFEVILPMTFGKWEIELSGGGDYDKKLRVYRQIDLSVGTSNTAASPTLTQNISSALSDENILNPDFDYAISYRSGLSRSYLAATTTDAFFGEVDVFYDMTWRVVLGARYEEYKQFSSPWQPFRLNGSPVRADFTQTNEAGFPEGTFYQDDVYPSLALTYSRPDFWADDFNLRFNASETIVRPDLREVSDSSYRDPLTDIVVNGNPDAIPSDITNYDMRAEWFFGNGDNLSLSLFYKDIENPLEYFQRTGSEDSITAIIENSETGESQGIEVEWLKGMEFLGQFASQFYISGNLTIADSEIELGDEISVSATNRVRPLRGASDYVVNLQFGFDSDDSKHAATIVYNVFGERLFTAGTGEEDDSFEQPFHAVDFSYSYFPTDNLTLKLKMRNLLDEKILIEQDGVDIYEESVGQSFSLGIKYDF